MNAFDIEPSRVIGDIKEIIKEAILDGNLKNDKQAAYEYMLEIGMKKGLLKSNNK
jgi:hypothetical protein